MDSLEYLGSWRYKFFHCCYYIKCLIWRRYNRISIKTLPPTWLDRTEVLPHAIFQILDDFIKEECSPGCVDWNSDDEHRNTLAEWKDHLAWWKDVYLKFDAYEGFDESQKAEDRFIDDGTGCYEIVFSDYEHEFYAASRLKEVAMETELERRLCRIIALRQWMWT